MEVWSALTMHQIVHEMSFKSVVNVLNSNPKNILRCLYNVSRVSKTAAAVNFFLKKKYFFRQNAIS